MSSRHALAPVDIKKFINKIFAQRGYPEVKNFPKEFADASKYLFIAILTTMFLVKFQELFNILYDERIDCKLIKSNLVEDRMLNWNRINGKIRV